MAIITECQNGHKLRANDDAVGKKVRCPKCQAVFVLGQAPRSKSRGEDRDDDAEFDFELDDAEASGPSRTPQRPPRSQRAKSAKKPTRDSRQNLPLIIGGSVLGVAAVVAAIFFLTHRSSGEPGGVEPVAQVESPQSTAAAATTNPVAAAASATPEPNPKPATPATIAAVGLASPKEDVSHTAAPTTAPATESAAPPVGNEPAAKAQAEPDQTPGETASTEGMHVWDTGDSAQAAAVPRPRAAPPKTWTSITPATAATYHFRGDCMIENEKLWLHIPHSQSATVSLSAKERAGVTVPISIGGGAAKSAGLRAISVTELSTDSTTVAIGAEGSAPVAACRLVKGKYWVEVAPKEGAERLNMGVNCQYVVVPTEFGEDAILDAALTGGKQSIPLPRENMLLALQSDGKYVAVMTYPSIDQAGDATMGPPSAPSDQNKASGGRVSSLSAKFAGNSVFVGMLPQKGTWYSEDVGKKYSASGQYPIDWKPPQPGVWRMAGRIQGKYFVTDVLDEHFIFACSQSGTMECLFAFLSRSPDETNNDVVTPMTIYQETLAATKADAYLLETEKVGSLDRRKTKYRDVCNSIDDIKDVWRNKPETLKSTPDYVSSLLADCKNIIERMDQRLREYEALTQHVGEVLPQITPKDSDKSDTALQSFSAAVRKSHNLLKAQKITSTSQSDKMAAEIEQTLQQQSTGGRLNAGELDRMAERLRDVASRQEEQLKKLRGIAIQLSDACSKHRQNAQKPWKQYVTLIGRHCRKVLRTRDPEE